MIDNILIFLGIWTILSFVFMWDNIGDKGLDYWRYPWYKKTYDYIMGTPVLIIFTIIMCIFDLKKWIREK